MAVPVAAAPAPQTAAPIAAPTPMAAAAPTPAFATQLARPLFTLAGATFGDHTMTITVTPDNLGPVTVRAHITADGMRVQLFAPTDAGRDALRAVLPDLRRDLAGSGINSSLDLSSQNQPSGLGSESSRHAHTMRALPDDDFRARAAEPVEERRSYAVQYRTSSTIDVMA
ncbi:MAG: flagellar hook-length control protein FliK [Terrimesophilobacter sp.]